MNARKRLLMAWLHAAMDGMRLINEVFCTSLTKAAHWLHDNHMLWQSYMKAASHMRLPCIPRFTEARKIQNFPCSLCGAS